MTKTTKIGSNKPTKDKGLLIKPIEMKEADQAQNGSMADVVFTVVELKMIKEVLHQTQISGSIASTVAGICNKIDLIAQQYYGGLILTQAEEKARGLQTGTDPNVIKEG